MDIATHSKPCPTCRQPRAVADGDQVRKARQLAGLSLREVGKAVGLSKMYLSDLERNNRTLTPGRAHELLEAIEDLRIGAWVAADRGGGG